MGITLYGVAASRAARSLWMLEELGIEYQHVPTIRVGKNLAGGIQNSGQGVSAEFVAAAVEYHKLPFEVVDIDAWRFMAASVISES